MVDDPMNRLKVMRGMQLPQSKLTDGDVRLVLAVIEERDKLKAQLSELTNAKLAEKFGVHRRTIDRISAGEAWTHI